MSQIDNIIYARDENLVITQSAFSKQDLAEIDQVKEIIVGSIKTRHLEFNFTTNQDTYSQDIPKHFDAFICTKSFYMYFPEQYLRSEIKLDIGDFIYFPSEIEHSIEVESDHYIYFEVYYWPKSKNEETDGQHYQIIATLTDKYEIQVFANSEKEAYDKAYSTPLSDWKHLTPGGISKPRKIIRWASWGDFETTEIN
jgi:hypothetical protein